MPNYYVAGEGVAARTIASTRPVVDPETGLESLPFVAPFTDEARLAGGSAADATVWATAPRVYAANSPGPASSRSRPPPSCPRPAHQARPGRRRAGPVARPEGVDQRPRAARRPGGARCATWPRPAWARRRAAFRCGSGWRLTRSWRWAATGWRSRRAGSSWVASDPRARPTAWRRWSRWLTPDARFRCWPWTTPRASTSGGCTSTWPATSIPRPSILAILDQMAAYKLNPPAPAPGRRRGLAGRDRRLAGADRHRRAPLPRPVRADLACRRNWGGPDSVDAGERLLFPCRLHRDRPRGPGAPHPGDPVLRHAGPFAGGDQGDGGPRRPAARRGQAGGRGRPLPAERGGQQVGLQQHPALHRQHHQCGASTAPTPSSARWWTRWPCCTPPPASR